MMFPKSLSFFHRNSKPIALSVWYICDGISHFSHFLQGSLHQLFMIWNWFIGISHDLNNHIRSIASNGLFCTNLKFPTSSLIKKYFSNLNCLKLPFLPHHPSYPIPAAHSFLAIAGTISTF